MCVESINGKRYVLVVVDEYSQYTWVFFLHSKDEAFEVIILFIKKTQVSLQLQVHHVRTDNDVEFKNKTLAEFFDKLKPKEDIEVFVGYSNESIAFRVYNKRTRKIHERVNVNFDEISEMDSKQLNLEPGLSKLNKTDKFSNSKVSQVLETSNKDLEDLFYNFYDEYFGNAKISKSLTTNVETSKEEISPSEEVFHEILESLPEESSSSSLHDDDQQRSEKVMVPLSNTQSVKNNIVHNVDEASTSHNVYNEQLEDAYFDASTTFHDPSNVHTFYHIVREICEVFVDLKLAISMSPPILKKYKNSIAIATGCKRFKKTRRSNRKIRIPIALWPDNYETSDEETEEQPRRRDLYRFVDHPQIQQANPMNEFAPHQIPQPLGNMNGWLIESEEEAERDEVDSDLESTASSKPVWEKNNKDDHGYASYHCPWCSK
ncbi:retrovirus-related pol polyprotein from transposon TNT 1-94 [Tanacetum coccineum]